MCLRLKLIVNVVGENLIQSMVCLIGSMATSLNEEWQLKPKPEEALDTRRNASGEVEVLVTRKGLLGVENSWELADKMRKEFPRFLLEVKENFEGGGIDSYDIYFIKGNVGKRIQLIIPL